MPEIISFRFNHGPNHNIEYNEYIDNPAKSKFGMAKAQLFSAFKKCKEYGVRRFGLHKMIVSYSLNVKDLAETARMIMFTLVVKIQNETGISAEFVKAGANMKAVFWLGITFLTQISRRRSKQSRISLLISHIYVLGQFVNFLVIFRYIWR